MGACAEQKAAGQTLRVEIGNEIGLIVARSAQGVHVGVVAQFAVLFVTLCTKHLVVLLLVLVIVFRCVV